MSKTAQTIQKFNKIVAGSPHPTGSKMCTKCNTIKDAKFFNKNAASPDGLQYWCIECTKAANKERNEKKKAERKASVQSIIDKMDMPVTQTTLEQKLAPLYTELISVQVEKNNKLRTNKKLSDLILYHELDTRKGLELLTLHLDNREDGLYLKKRPASLKKFAEKYLYLIRRGSEKPQDDKLVLQQLMEKVDALTATISRLVESTRDLDERFKEWSK